MSIEIDCPSGLQLRVRGLKGKEGKLLADKAAIRQGNVLDNMLTACTEEVLDPGPYETRSDGKLDWGKVLLGDRFYALMQVRMASFGPEYAFKVQCRDQACRERFEWDLNLNDLEVRRMNDEDRETFRSDGAFTTELSDGTKVKYRLAVGADEKAVARNRTQDRALVDMLALRIVSIEGVGEFKPTDAGRAVRSVKGFLEDLEWSELVKLLNALDSHDCGVKTDIEIECPACGSVQEVQLPFERGFFLPTETTTKKPASLAR